MKQAALLISLYLLTAGAAMSQINWKNYSQSYTGGDASSPGMLVALRSGNDFLWSVKKHSSLFDSIRRNRQETRPAQILARTTFDGQPAHFFLPGIGREQAARYRFRVTEYPGNRVLVPWGRISRFADSTVREQSGESGMAYLGGYKADFGKAVVVDVRPAAGDRIAATAVVAWEDLTPVITNVYTSANLDQFLRKLQHPWAPVNDSSGTDTGMISMPADNASIIFELSARIFYKTQIQYELLRNGSPHTAWKHNEFDNSFIWIRDLQPGNYKIRIRYTGQPDRNIAEYGFAVEPMWYQTNLFRITAGICVAALLGACISFMLFMIQRRRTREELAKQTRLQLELKTIYAQLNPHFVFNALSSIQGLINTHDLRSANQYLADFARLMRESLKHSNREEISLHEEIRTLETYLRLEQLRFGFRYRMTTDPDIPVYETGIPALLLQPLVENAVKHGVSNLQEAGGITVDFQRRDDSLVAVITDNGPGFQAEPSAGGIGLKLTRDRIGLLNALKPHQLIELSIQRKAPSGTEVTLTFNEWFL